MIDIMNVKSEEIYKVKRVYVAGPFTGNTPWDTYQNTLRAEALSAELWKRCAGKIAVVTPHLNSGNMIGAAPEYAYLVGGFAMVDVCHALFAMEDWQRSRGTKGEILRSIEKDIPVFFDKEDLVDWIHWDRLLDRLCMHCKKQMDLIDFCYHHGAGICNECLAETCKEPRYKSNIIHAYLSSKGAIK